MSRRFEIPATPENMVWGYLDSTTPPVLEVTSGDVVTLHSFPAGGKETLPDTMPVPADYQLALDTLPQGAGPHFITGPVYVKDARPGDVLQVDIIDVKVRQDWGFVSILPLLGTLPDEFTDYETIHPTVDHDRNVCVLPWGTEIPLDPFFGIIATVALTVNMVLLLALMSLLGATLTLPGIAGIVLTMGMAVDANVLIFSRIREEIAAGMTVQRAINEGFGRAFTAILDSNLTTLLVGGILFAMGTGPVKGFAVTMSLGIFTSMFTAIMVTRAMVNLIFGGRDFKKLWI